MVMVWKKILSAMLSCAIIFGCGILMGVSTFPDDNFVYQETLPCSKVELSTMAHLELQPVARASGSFSADIPANSGITVDDSFYLRENGTVTFNCTYTPSSASVQFGLVDSNNVFHYLTATTGNINRSLRVSTRGSYTLAIWNDSDSTVSVTGYVNY